MKRQILAALCSALLCSSSTAFGKDAPSPQRCKMPLTGTWVIKSTKFYGPPGSKPEFSKSESEGLIGKTVSFSEPMVFFIDRICRVKSVNTYIPDPEELRKVPELSDRIIVSYRCSTPPSLPSIHIEENCETASFLLGGMDFYMTRSTP